MPLFAAMLLPLRCCRHADAIFAAKDDARHDARRHFADAD